MSDTVRVSSSNSQLIIFIMQGKSLEGTLQANAKLAAGKC